MPWEKGKRYALINNDFIEDPTGNFLATEMNGTKGYLDLSQYRIPYEGSKEFPIAPHPNIQNQIPNEQKQNLQIQTSQANFLGMQINDIKKWLLIGAGVFMIFHLLGNPFYQEDENE